LFSGIFINLGILFFYKYYEFAGSLITDFFSLLNIGIDIPRWNVLLPVGISFYIFQAVGYAVDVYRGTIKAEKNFVVYALFISFFPQLVAGPIERAKNMLPQFREKHKFSYENFDAGLRLMIWGFFMKLCVADRVSTYVDAVYNNYMEHSGVSLLLATFFFTFQIYCDFAGYSLIAIGSSKMMGFTLMENFHRPYFAKSIKEFWRRWHISLSTWFKDYLYIPLGGNRVGHYRHLWNLFVTFLVSGIWHGANLTFVLWGSLHGLYQIVGIEKNRLLPKVNVSKRLHAVFNCLVTFVLVMFAWIFFRANDLHSAFSIIAKIFTDRGPLFTGEGIPSLLLGFMCIGILMLKEIKDEMSIKVHALNSKNYWVRIISISLFIAFIILTASFNGGAFIYFQF
ncbi:MAG: MBOAT family O-acyltransferase, partial [Barnesiella intestinihominis]